MNIEDLVAYGANVEEGLSRCMGNEGFYLRMVETVRSDEGYDTLQAAVSEGRLGDAFEAAHALKGALSNLAITPLSEPVSEITELLRSETDMDYSALMATIMQKRDELRAL